MKVQSLSAGTSLWLLLSSRALAFTVRQQSTTTSTRLYGDGNPPPFGNWNPPAPAAAPEAAPAPYDYSSWGQPAAAPPAPAPPASYDYSSWGQPAAAPEAPAAAVAAPAMPSPAVAPMATGGDPIATLQASQQVVVDEICAGIADLESKPDFCWTAGETVGGNAATLTAMDAPGAANIAWLAHLGIVNQLCSLTIFNGPLSDVPHLQSSVAVVDNGSQLQVRLDARPRAYGAYETVDASGNYPGPDELGRKAFEYSGARTDYFGKYATAELEALLNPAQFEGATVLPPLSDLESLTAGPWALNVQMPASAANVQTVQSVRDAVARLWLTWSLTADQHRPGAPINTQYVYDAKFRQNAYGALLAVHTDLFGGNADEASRVAVAESGPLDQAYVGGGS